MHPKTAFLVDADFFLRQYQYHVAGSAPMNPVEVAKALRRQCKAHLFERRRESGRTPPERIGRLYRIFVYDCPPLTKKAHHPQTGNAIDFSKTDLAKFRFAFHDALRVTPHVALRMGYLDEGNARWELANPRNLKELVDGSLKIEQLKPEDFLYRPRQKAVDMELGLDIAALAYKRLVERIVLIAGDSDFVPAARLARREGIEFVLDPMWKTIKPDLQEHIDVLRTTIPRKGASAPEQNDEVSRDD